MWAAIITATVFLIGVISVHFLGDDNPIEEACEEIIKLETGKEIDLSPKSPEKK